MTISLLIEHKNPETKNRSIPVATHAAFTDYWLPICRERGLTLIPLFITGYPLIELNLDTLPTIIDELSQIKDAAMNRADCSGWLPKRIESVIEGMKYVQENFDQIEQATV